MVSKEDIIINLQVSDSGYTYTARRNRRKVIENDLAKAIDVQKTFTLYVNGKRVSKTLYTNNGRAVLRTCPQHIE